MKKFGIISLTLLNIVFSACVASEPVVEKPMVIVITSYNNKEYYKKNLDSVLSQDYKNYRILYVEDKSPDGTGKLVRDYIKEKGKESLVTLIENEERVGALANLYKAIMQVDKNHIVVNVDGDDWLPNNQVLNYLNKVYADPDVWMTYGQFIIYPSNAQGFAFEIPAEVIAKNNLREFKGGITHLRSFYAGLFHRIKKEDLYHNGNFYMMAGDIAHLVPMSEMAGKHMRFIPDILYVYNWANPINDDRTNQALQRQLDDEIRAKPKYSALEKLD